MQVFHGNINFLVPRQNNRLSACGHEENFSITHGNIFSFAKIKCEIRIVISKAVKSIATCHWALDSSQLSFSSHYRRIACQIFLENAFLISSFQTGAAAGDDEECIESDFIEYAT